jgi:ABC-type multidrug transport system ATPase subunit
LSKSNNYREVLERIVTRLEGHPLPLPVHAPLRFVDRVREAKAILDEGEKVVLNGMITVLYGPKGCGKTSLFKALYEVVTSMQDVDVDVVIVGSEKEAWRAEKLYIPKH